MNRFHALMVTGVVSLAFAAAACGSDGSDVPGTSVPPATDAPASSTPLSMDTGTSTPHISTQDPALHPTSSMTGGDASMPGGGDDTGGGG